MVPQIPAINMSSSRLSQLEFRISNLERELAVLRQERNHLAAPLFRMPDELIAKILDYLHLDGYDGQYHSAHQTVHVPICRRIRAVTLQMPELWSTIQLGKNSNENVKEWIDICDQRRQGCLLMLRIHMDSFDATHLPELGSLMAHTRTLHVHQHDNQDSDRDLLLGFTWPALEHLEIVSKKADRFNDVPWLIFANTLGQSLDGLTSLDLIGIYLFIELPRLPSLRHISIDMVHHRQDNYEIFRELFESSSKLMTIKIGRILSRSDRPPRLASYENPVSLPNLHSVSLSGFADAVVLLLGMLPRTIQDLSVDLLDFHSPGAEASTTYTQVVQMILDYVENSQSGSDPWQYATLLFLPDKSRDSASWLSARIASTAQLSYADPSQPRLSRFHFTCDESLLLHVLPHTPVVEFMVHQDVDLGHPMAAIACTHKDITYLDLTEFADADHWTDEFSDVLEGYLRKRMEQGHALHTLAITYNCFWVYQADFEEWEREGLMKKIEAHSIPGEGWDSDDGSSDSIEQVDDVEGEE